MFIVADTEAGTNQQFATKEELVAWAMKEAPSDFGASGRVKYLEALLVDMFGVLEKEMAGIKKLPPTIREDVHEKLHTRLPAKQPTSFKSFLSPISTNVDPLKKDTNKTAFQKKIEDAEISMGTALEALEGAEKQEEAEDEQVSLEESKEEKFDRLMSEHRAKETPPVDFYEAFDNILGVTDLTKVEKDTSEIKQRMRYMETSGTMRVEDLEHTHKTNLADLVDWFAEKFCEPTIEGTKPEEDWKYQNMLVFTDLCWKLFIRNPDGICTTILKQVLPVKIKTVLETISTHRDTFYDKSITTYLKKTGYNQSDLELTSIQKYQPGLLIKQEYFQEFRTVYNTLLDRYGEHGGLDVFDRSFTPMSYNNIVYFSTIIKDCYVRYQAVKDLFDTYDLFLRGDVSADTTYKWMFRCCQEKYVKDNKDGTGIRSSEIDTEVRGYFNKVFGSAPKLEEKLLSFLTPQFFSRSMAKMEFNKVRRGKGYYYTNILTAEEVRKQNPTGPPKYEYTLKKEVKTPVSEVQPMLIKTTLCGDSNILSYAPYV